jgi:hypothetical protein
MAYFSTIKVLICFQMDSDDDLFRSSPPSSPPCIPPSQALSVSSASSHELYEPSPQSLGSQHILPVSLIPSWLTSVSDPGVKKAPYPGSATLDVIGTLQCC